MCKRVGFIGIIVHERERVSEKVNKILSENGSCIVARLGVPYKDRNLSVISLVVDMTTDELGSLTGKLGAIEGVSIKSALAKQDKE